MGIERQNRDSVRDRSHPVVAITMGDMNGVGPEIILKALAQMRRTGVPDQAGTLLFASPEALQFYSRITKNVWDTEIWNRDALGRDYQYTGDFAFPDNLSGTPVPGPGEVILVPCRQPAEPVRPGVLSAESGTLSMHAVAAGVKACLSGQADALVTAPISKEVIHKAGFRVPGHTEYLAELTGSTNVGMMLVNPFMRIGLATIHIPIAKVSANLTRELVASRLRLYHDALKRDFGILQPHIAVLGLNPHAGDGGVLGTEEREIIIPVIEKMRAEGLNADGPWPADGFFGSKGHERADLVLAMYHDQGLIPLKLAGFGNGVNVTAGLPIIRTSPDHGTAFSLAGKNMADEGSMNAAIALALDMVKRRKVS